MKKGDVFYNIAMPYYKLRIIDVKEEDCLVKTMNKGVQIEYHLAKWRIKEVYKLSYASILRERFK